MKYLSHTESPTQALIAGDSTSSRGVIPVGKWWTTEEARYSMKSVPGFQTSKQQREIILEERLYLNFILNPLCCN